MLWPLIWKDDDSAQKGLCYESTSLRTERVQLTNSQLLFCLLDTQVAPHNCFIVMPSPSDRRQWWSSYCLSNWFANQSSNTAYPTDLPTRAPTNWCWSSWPFDWCIQTASLVSTSVWPTSPFWDKMVAKFLASVIATSSSSGRYNKNGKFSSFCRLVNRQRQIVSAFDSTSIALSNSPLSMRSLLSASDSYSPLFRLHEAVHANNIATTWTKFKRLRSLSLSVAVES